MPPNMVNSRTAPLPSADLNELVDSAEPESQKDSVGSGGVNGGIAPRVEADSIHLDPTSPSKVAASSSTVTATTASNATANSEDAATSANDELLGTLSAGLESVPEPNGAALESNPTPVPAGGVDKLSSHTAALSLTSDESKADATQNPASAERPRTPPTETPVGLQEVTSPPPPPPPPKDVPPKDLPPKDLPPKDGSAESSKERLYLDPPLTPVPSRPSSPLPSPTAEAAPRKSLSRSEHTSDDEAGDNTRSEIHDLFEKSHRASISEEMRPSPILPSTPSLSSPSLVTPRHPPRSSSLTSEAADQPPVPPIQTAPVGSPRIMERRMFSPTASPDPQGASSTPVTPHRPPPPDDDLPFDFHRFLSQLRHRSADPVAKFLRSFLSEFAKKQWMVHEQVKIVQDFLHFIYGKMEGCEVWRDVGDVEMDNAREGMEKLVMNRLYTQTFSPAIPPVDHSGRILDEKFPGRGGQHQEDVERDEVLTQKVRIYSWIREEHLDIEDTVTGEGGRRFLDLAVKEMLKIGSYRAPRDKVICVLNCCKVIFGLLRHSKSEESADKFVPLLIYVVLRANPAHLVSNVQYILRFRNPDKLNGEAGYYLSSLMGAIQFIENLDRSSLTITPEEFEANVEAAVAAIAERPPPPSPTQQFSEKPRRSTDRDPRTSTSSREAPGGDGAEEQNAVSGLLKTIQKPLSTIGRMFSDDPSTSAGPASTSQPGTTPRHSPAAADDAVLTALGGRRGAKPTSRERQRLSAEESAARQASAEAEEAARIGQLEYENVVEILKGMFPALDKDVIGDVVRMKEGRVGLAVDACLALSAG